ncbi:MAG: hypothetical protein MUO96_04655 [Actinobacteria bacterium]|nr:hypothetical protein [Actinomycetota bacterium]
MRDRSAKLFLRARNLFIYRNFEKQTVENELDDKLDEALYVLGLTYLDKGNKN